MLGSLIGFIELGGIILAWMIVWNILIGAFAAHHSNWTSMQGLQAAFQS